MPKAKNISVVSDLKDKVAKAKSLVVTDYRGLTHKQAEELHRAVKKQGGEFVVVKNSLLRIASRDTNYQILNTDVSGPTAILLSYEDEFNPLKELYKTIKTLNLPIVKFGFINGTKYEGTDIGSIAKLPSQDILRGQVVSRLSAPIYGLLYALNGNLQKLAIVLSKIKT